MSSSDEIDDMDENNVKHEPFIDINETPATDGISFPSLTHNQVRLVFSLGMFIVI